MKIAFFTTEMGSGGVEKALLELLKKMEELNWDITLFLLKERGAFMNQIPAYVHMGEWNIEQDKIIKAVETHPSIKRIIYTYTLNGNIIKAIHTAKQYILDKDWLYFLPEGSNSLPGLQQEFDVAICYHIHYPFNLVYVADKVVAKRKIAFVHNDFLHTGFECKRLQRYLNKYDKFYVVSKELEREFEQFFPDYAEKSAIFHNIVNCNEICEKSKLYLPKEFARVDCLKICSVGRLDNQKGFDIAIKVASKMRDEGLDFVWCIIGEGIEKDTLENMIAQNNLEKQVILVGMLENPYPYMKAANIYVQPSRHEGYGITIEEARILCVPIVCTDFVGALEQLRPGETGSIVEVSVDAIYGAILELIENPELAECYRINLRNERMLRIENNLEYNAFISYCEETLV